MQNEAPGGIVTTICRAGQATIYFFPEQIESHKDWRQRKTATVEQRGCVRALSASESG